MTKEEIIQALKEMESLKVVWKNKKGETVKLKKIGERIKFKHKDLITHGEIYEIIIRALGVYYVIDNIDDDYSPDYYIEISHSDIIE